MTPTQHIGFCSSRPGPAPPHHHPGTEGTRGLDSAPCPTCRADEHKVPACRLHMAALTLQKQSQRGLPTPWRAHSSRSLAQPSVPPRLSLPFLYHLVGPDAPYINSSYGEMRAPASRPGWAGNQHWRQTREQFSNCRRQPRSQNQLNCPKQHLFAHKSKSMETYQTARHTVKASIVLEISIPTACACACVCCMHAGTWAWAPGYDYGTCISYCGQRSESLTGGQP